MHTQLFAALFQVASAKRKPGYENFAVAEPRLNLVLLENPGRGGTITISVWRWSPPKKSSPRSPGSAAKDCSPRKRSTRLVAFATQDKVWVTAHGNEKWEVYTAPSNSDAFGTSPELLSDNDAQDDEQSAVLRVSVSTQAGAAPTTAEADRINTFTGRVGQCPVAVTDARKHRARVAAAHGDDHVSGPDDQVGPWFREFPEMSMPRSFMASIAAGLISLPGSDPPGQLGVGRIELQHPHLAGGHPTHNPDRRVDLDRPSARHRRALG